MLNKSLIQRNDVKSKSLILLFAGMAFMGYRFLYADDKAQPVLKPKGFTISSSAFDDSARIPDRYTCLDKKQISPPLTWLAYPSTTKSFVLIMDDPDAIPVAGFTWQHWALFDIPDTVNRFAEGVKAIAGALSGKNSFGRLGYGGPCPPHGQNHRYCFRLYALDRRHLGLQAGASVESIRKAMQGHILDSCLYIGRFSR